MDHFNYRVIKLEQDNYPSFGIHEVYYDKKNKIEAWTEDSLIETSDTLVHLKREIFGYLEAITLPPLTKIETTEGKELVAHSPELATKEETLNEFEITLKANHFLLKLISDNVLMKENPVLESLYSEAVEAIKNLATEGLKLTKPKKGSKKK